MPARKLAALPALSDAEDRRLLHALALEGDVRAIEHWLEATDVLEELFADSGDHVGGAALRGVAGRIRERRNDLNEEIRRLRAAAK